MKSIEPFCVILTHRHGACVGIVNSELSKILKLDFVETSRAYFLQKSSLLQIKNHFEFFRYQNSFFCARVLGKTAENLSHLFQFSCDELGINIPEIKKFIVGTGPGSFTGLRLGCAFVNGIHFASNAELFSVPTLLVNQLNHELHSEKDLINVFINELGIYNEQDHSSGYVTFFDLFYIMHQIAQNNLKTCNPLIPNYCKKSNPVLNLRKE